MPQVKGDVIKDRAKRLREAGDEAIKRHLERLIGTEQEVLVERGGIARTPCFTPVQVGDQFEAGCFVNIRIAGYASNGTLTI